MSDEVLCKHEHLTRVDSRFGDFSKLICLDCGTSILVETETIDRLDALLNLGDSSDDKKPQE